MKQVRISVIFAAVIGVAVQIIGGAVVIGADDALQPLITTSELIVGQNRFAFGLAKQGKLIEHADVLVRLFELEGTEAHLTAETNAPFRPVANPVPEKKFIFTPMVAAMFTTAPRRCGGFTWRSSLLPGPVIGALSSWHGNRTGCPRRRDLRS